MQPILRSLAAAFFVSAVVFRCAPASAEEKPGPADDAANAAAAAPPADAAQPKPSTSIFPKAGAPDPRPFTLTDRYFDAARRGDMAAVRLCLDKGVDPKVKDQVGRSALAYAVRDGRSLEIVELLAGLGLPVDEPDAAGRSPLDDAAGNGDTAITAWLLKHGAKLDRKDMQGRTPLQTAVLAGSRQLVVMMLEAGADPNQHDNFGDTPLIQACNKGIDEIAKVLVEKGADVTAKDQEGRTAAQRAEETAPYCRSLTAAKPAS
ncbi:MAG TPA: ankyrin repeat domain-containing protein [Candidatus Limnocylindrales bacterium]|nr:ankyrin repeat domain-containing protein [Candidatus Limnocylindrales bacterium]